MEVLRSHHWPGNARELIQVLRFAGIHFSGAEIGAEIREALTLANRAIANSDDLVDRAWQELESGKTFWEAVKSRYLERDLNREQVKAILERGLQQTKGTYRGLLRLFHLQESEYKTFMSFLYDNHLR